MAPAFSWVRSGARHSSRHRSAGVRIVGVGVRVSSAFFVLVLRDRQADLVCATSEGHGRGSGCARTVFETDELGVSRHERRFESQRRRLFACAGIAARRCTSNSYAEFEQASRLFGLRPASPSDAARTPGPDLLVARQCPAARFDRGGRVGARGRRRASQHHRRHRRPRVVDRSAGEVHARRRRQILTDAWYRAPR